MKLNFRQGLVSFQQSGPLPTFLQASTTPGYVSLNVAPKPTIVTIAHGSSDYLLKFDQTIPAAWGPMVSGQDNYLYLNLDVISGEVTRGITTIEPVTSLTEPAEPLAGAMWFDLTEKVMKVRNPTNQKWVVQPRVVVGKVLSGNTSQIAPYTVGSTVGLQERGSPGFLVFDSQLRPLRTSTGELLTQDTPVRVKSTVGSSGVLTNAVNDYVPVRAAEPIPAMRLVNLSGTDAVSLASSDPALITMKPPVGVVEDALAINEVGVITQGGEITYDQWNWPPSDHGKPLYSGFHGEITTTRPHGTLVYRVGYVKNEKTILLNIDSETEVQVVSADGSIISGVPPIQTSTTTNSVGEIVTSVSILPATSSQDGAMTAEQAELLETFDARITTNTTDIDTLETTKANVNHTHIIGDVTGLQPALDGKANVSHTHVIGDVTNLQVELNNRALVNHTHAISEVNGLQTALDNKSAVGHTHTANQITDFSEAVDDRVSTLVQAGDNVTLTYNDAANSLRIDAVGGASALGELSDVAPITYPIDNGLVLTYNATTTKWVPAAMASGGAPRLHVVDVEGAVTEPTITDVSKLSLLNGLHVRGTFIDGDATTVAVQVRKSVVVTVVTAEEAY